MGFPINPAKIPLVDKNGLCSPAWYIFFANIQKMLGGPGDPLDDSTLMGGASSFGADTARMQDFLPALNDSARPQDFLPYLNENASMADLTALLMQANEARNETVYLVSSVEPGKLTASTGLTGGGNMANNVTLALANTSVTAGSYGSATQVGTFTVDAQGRLTAAANASILGGLSLSASGDRWGVIPFIGGDGTFEVGRYIDFHNSDADATDFAVRLDTNGGTTDLYINGFTIYRGAGIDVAIADGGTGASTAAGARANLGISSSLFDHYTTVGNGTTVETDLYSDTLAAGQLAANGDKIEAEYGGLFVSSGTATRQIKIYFGGTAIFDTGALTLSLSSAWTCYVSIIRVSSTVIRYMISMTTEGAALAAYTAVGELTGLTLSNTNILKITGTAAGIGAASSDITARMGSVLYIPAA